MNLLLNQSTCLLRSEIAITGSKSETNRLLLLKALFPNITLSNTSNSDDSEVMEKALTENTQVVDIHHAGTAMRFLTAYFATQPGCELVLTGSARMQERPIKILVDALQQLGAKITYEKNEGYPPIKIVGQKITKTKVSLPANVSSQYISALLLVASKLENGLELTLEGEITSIPYIKMTLRLLNEIGAETRFEGNTITVKPFEIEPDVINLTVESDWSSASYFYSIVALSSIGTTIKLSSYKVNSLQGDSSLSEIYRQFGVETTFKSHTILLEKISQPTITTTAIDLNSSPDIAQTIAVTCLGLGIGCYLTGLHTLKIKETDRLEALRIELSKLGAKISVTNDTLTLESGSKINENCVIDTYNDHRMAMAFAPLALRVPIIINEAEVVSKSYPDFWDDMKTIGISIDNL
jgi:3-phosphoshikimate 1-carboxyvinyltransferase